MNIKHEKQKLRNEFKMIRECLDVEQKRDLDLDLQSRFLTLKEYNKANLILTYIAKEDEIETRDIIYAALLNGKCVAVPKLNCEDYSMDFYYIDTLKKCKMSSFGILEPLTSVCEKVSKNAEGLCIVPGLSFDANGYRLGYGKGCYDKFLQDFKGTTVGLLPSCCMKLKLPTEEHDYSVDIIITEKYIRRLKY